MSCKQDFISPYGVDYLNDSTLSYKNGIIKDSTRFFLPSNLMKSSFGGLEPSIDSFKLHWFSRSYLCFREPVLYNYYLGYENYRFLWLRSFDRSVVITIKNAKKATICTKILKNPAHIMSVVFKNGHWTARTFEMDIEKIRGQIPDADSIVVPRFNDKLLLDTTFTISKKQWTGFKELIDSCNFWRLEPSHSVMGTDGSEWILEGQSLDKYHFVSRWSPKDTFARCCEYLIKLSSAKHEEIY
jgi:hypothetical protein